MRNGYLLLLEGVILVDCCEARKKDLEQKYTVVVVKHVENSAVKVPHCGLGCLKGGIRG